MPRFCAILPAAGQSTRFGGGRNKLLEILGGEPIITRSISSLSNHPSCEHVIVAADDSEIAELVRARWSNSMIVPGGATRANSVLSGLTQAPSNCEWVAIHDAARPLVSKELIERVFSTAIEHGAAAPVLPVNATIKQATGPLPSKVERTVARQNLWAMQTPQIMRRQALLQAYERCPLPLEQITDDVQLLELAGQEVWLVPGDERNLKITTPLDLQLAELLLR